MKIKLTTTQSVKLNNAVGNYNGYREQSEIANRQFKQAERSAMDLFETICDAHGVDVNKIDRSNFSVKDGYLLLNEIKTEKKSTSIRKQLKPKK